MKRSQTFEDLSQDEETPDPKPTKKPFLASVKLPKFPKIPKLSSKSKGSSSRESSPSKSTDSYTKCDSYSKTDQPSSETIPCSEVQTSKTATDEVTKPSNHEVTRPVPNHEITKTVPNHENAELARQHYNKLEQVSLAQRGDSRIANLRGFNNYVKSLVMNDFRARIGPLGDRGAVILDLACGKGGDLRKWGLAKPSHVVCVDIADVSIAQCKTRYEERPRELTFKANFIVSDCTRDDLSDKYTEHNIHDVEFDLVSCQFALHYAFESQVQAIRMIKNATSRLKPNCFFFGTIPRSDYFVKRYKTLTGGDTRFGNDVFHVDFTHPGITHFPLFSSQYVFYLDGAVETLPEYLIHFPLLKVMMEAEGCECVLECPFSEYIYDSEGRMKEVDVVSKTRGLNSQGTISREEWEVINCYMVFGFRKLPDSEREQRRDCKRRKVEEEDPGDRV
eukprot:sb/3464667/